MMQQKIKRKNVHDNRLNISRCSDALKPLALLQQILIMNLDEVFSLRVFSVYISLILSFKNNFKLLF